MTLENQCCTFQQGERLREFGVNYPSTYSYAFNVCNMHASDTIEGLEWNPEYSETPDLVDSALALFDGLPHVQVYNVAELCEMLGKAANNCYFIDSRTFGIRVITAPLCKTLAEALAALLIRRLEQQEIKAEECNQRLENA